MKSPSHIFEYSYLVPIIFLIPSTPELLYVTQAVKIINFVYIVISMQCMHNTENLFILPLFHIHFII